MLEKEVQVVISSMTLPFGKVCFESKLIHLTNSGMCDLQPVSPWKI